MRITNAEIVAVAEGVADRETERRVLGAALHDPEIREKLCLARGEDFRDSDASGDRGSDGAERLRAAMLRAAREVARRPPG